MTKSLCLSTLTQRDGAINLQRTWRDITQLKQDKAPRVPCPLPLSLFLSLLLSLAPLCGTFVWQCQNSAIYL